MFRKAALTGLAALTFTAPANAQMPAPEFPLFEPIPVRAEIENPFSDDYSHFDYGCTDLPTRADLRPQRETTPRGNFFTLRESETPAVLIEWFHINNTEDALMWKDRCVAWNFVKEAAKGADAWARKRYDEEITWFITDGHGLQAPGARNDLLGVTERDYTRFSLQPRLAAALERLGHRVVTLNYDGPEVTAEDMRTRLSAYVQAANFYQGPAPIIDVHANSVPLLKGMSLPTAVYTLSRGRSRMTWPGRIVTASEASRTLAEEIAARTTPLYCGVRPDMCVAPGSARGSR